MIEAFVAAVLAIVVSISAAVSGSVPASKDTNPSDEAKISGSAVSEYVKENHPTGAEPSNVVINNTTAEDNANLGVSERTPEEPKLDGQTFGQSVSEVNSNADFANSVADSQPEAAKADGRAFGSATSDSRKP
ncbi:MAG: hypothetical protein WD231_02435 [Candidatus Woykebacteria bacterium]